ncbi:MAG TPA: hypothetical protein DEG92_07500 [Rikenellaceae bacterium]|nr:hypothetical protein [Rikenellaceae bacterium]
MHVLLHIRREWQESDPLMPFNPFFVCLHIIMGEQIIKTTTKILSIATFLAAVLSFNILSAQETGSITTADTIKKATPVIVPLTKYQLRIREKAQKDSLRYIRDSIKSEIPRILESYIIPDSLKYKKIILWNYDSYLNRITGMLKQDTTFNGNFHFLPFMKKDVGATYLGVSGSAAQSFNYFLRDKSDFFTAFDPYIPYSYTKESHPFYNVKTPHTELAYRGTILAERAKEETNIHFLTTQNISPQFNFTVLYERYGGKGILNKESTDNRTFSLTSNYLGKRYVAHAGYIFQSIKREENGGIFDDTMVLDTNVNPKAIDYRLNTAYNRLRRNSVFLTHSYGIPIHLSKKDTLNNNSGTVAYIGHSFEFATYYRRYTDAINLSDTEARNFYNNRFFINAIESNDSTRLNLIENRFFIRLQPWAIDGIISKLDGGVGHQYVSYYTFRPDNYIGGMHNSIYNNVYAYFGASGQFRKYLMWEGNGKLNLAGYNSGDFNVDAKVRLSVYPIKEGIHLTGKLKIANTTTDLFNSYYYSNHFFWDNKFGKTTETRVEALLDIPKFKLQAFFGYSLLNNYIYYNNLGDATQNGNLLNVMSASAKFDFRLWKFHFFNRVLFQLTSDQEVMPLPLLSANLRYFFQFVVVKNVMTLQLGVDVLYHTKYFAPSYNPALGQFHTQNERKIGAVPYIDPFINIQWKQASIFIKYMNAAQGWPTGDYFSANHYIRPMRAIQFGLNWPFYIK